MWCLCKDSARLFYTVVCQQKKENWFTIFWDKFFTCNKTCRLVYLGYCHRPSVLVLRISNPDKHPGKRNGLGDCRALIDWASQWKEWKVTIFIMDTRWIRSSRSFFSGSPWIILRFPFLISLGETKSPDWLVLDRSKGIWCCLSAGKK